MGYTTEFDGQIQVDPPLSQEEADFLIEFSKTRHMERARGPYYVDGAYGHGDNSDVPDYNKNGSKPGLWCHWVPNDDGTAIEWDGSEKFYHAEEWMRYLIDHFFRVDRIADLPFLQAHTLNGTILAQGEEIRDRWNLIVTNNAVEREDLE